MNNDNHSDIHADSVVSRNVNVIGSGVLGLTCALELAKKACPKYRVTIITAAKDLTINYQSANPHADLIIEPDFASPWAGAMWHPFTPHPASELEKRIAGWEAASFLHLRKISEQHPEVVMEIDFEEYYDRRLSATDVLPWYMDICPQARKLNDEELVRLPKGKADGITFKSVSLNPLRYLDYLRKQLIALDVKIVHHRLESASEAFAGLPEKNIPPADMVVNASGLGAEVLGDVNDASVEPIRGQTILIQSPKPMAFATKDNEKLTYIICRPLTTPVQGQGQEVVLGGCYQVGNRDLSVDEELSRRILDEALAICPGLSHDGTVNGVKILKQIVALRPARKNGPRLEAEELIIPSNDDNQNSTRLLVHCYGIGGTGYQASYGMAAEVESLISKHIYDKKVLSRPG